MLLQALVKEHEAALETAGGTGAAEARARRAAEDKPVMVQICMPVFCVLLLRIMRLSVDVCCCLLHPRY